MSIKSPNKEMKSHIKGNKADMVDKSYQKETPHNSKPLKGMKSKEMKKEGKSMGSMNPPEGFGSSGYTMKGPMMDYGTGAKMSGGGDNNHAMKEGYLSAHEPDVNEVGKGEKE